MSSAEPTTKPTTQPTTAPTTGPTTEPTTEPMRRSPQVETATRRGWQVLRLVSPDLVVELVPGKGGDICDLRRRRDDLAILGTTPWGLRPFGIVSAPANASALATETWAGGWRTLFPNAGRSSVSGGVELGESGEACLTWYDWQAVDDLTGLPGGSPADAAVRLTARLARVPFELSRVVAVSGPTVTIVETVRNVGREDVEVMWAQELMITAPILGPDATFDAGATIVRPDTDVVSTASWDDLMPWPRAHGQNRVINLRSVPGPDEGETRKAYLTDFTASRMTVTNAELDVSLGLTWDADHWPYAWYELEAGGADEYPWYKGGYHLAIGPASSWPARGVHEARRLSELLTFAAGEERTASLTLTVGPA